MTRNLDGPVRAAAYAFLPALAGWTLFGGIVAAIWWAVS